MLTRFGAARWWRAWDAEDGISLVEMMFAILLLAVAIMALATTAVVGLTNLRSARDREEATNAASAAIEAIRTGQYDQIFMDPSDPNVTALGGCYEGEPVASNAVASPIQVESTNDQVSLRTYVTWFQSTDDADCSGVNDEERLAKRVTVIAEWNDGQFVRSVREDTIVAPAGRGLPVPDFDLNPTTAAINFDPDDVAAAETKCQRHQLRNLGAEDSYDWDLTSVDPSVGPPFKATPTSFKTADNNWEVEAYFQFPGSSTASTPDPTDPDTQAMTDLDANGRPETTVRVPGSGVANVWFCWTPASSVTVGDAFDAVLTMHSLFDGNRIESVTHSVGVSETPVRLFLFDHDDSTAHARAGRVRAGTFEPEPFPMGPEDGIVGSTDNLGATLFDWDTNIDSGANPGIVLPAGEPNLAGVWDEQWGGPTTVERAATLTLYVASPLALGAGAPTGQTLRLGIDLQRLEHNEKLDAHLVTVSPVAVNVAATGWTRVEIPIDLLSEQEFAASQFLRVQVSCLATSDAACHIAYDNTTYASNLAVNLR